MKRLFQFVFYSSTMLALSGFAGLYLGWTQFNYPTTYRGVIYFKTSGYDEVLLNPQNWYWNWQNIIPGNSTVYAVNLSPQEGSFRISGNLPSAEALSELIERKETFSYDLQVDYTYLLKEESLVSLYSTGVLNESDSQASLKGLLEKPLREGIQSLLSNLFTNMATSKLEEILQIQLKKELLKSINTEFSYLQNFDLDIKTIHFPNLLLYQEANKILLSILTDKEQAQRAEKIKQIKDVSEEENRLLWLKRYGNLLKEYPELKELLTSENLKLFSFFR